MFSRRKTLTFDFKKERKVSLHTFFVFFPIKVEYLDAKKNVVETTIMKPFTFYTPKKKARYIVETPIDL